MKKIINNKRQSLECENYYVAFYVILTRRKLVMISKIYEKLTIINNA